MLLLKSFFFLMTNSTFLYFLGSFTTLLSPQFRSVVVLLLEDVGTGFWESASVIVFLTFASSQFMRAVNMTQVYLFTLAFSVS